MIAQGMPRRVWLRACAAAGLAGVFPRVLAGGPDAVVVPGMHRLRGDVTVNGQPAHAGQFIKAGDMIATGSDAEAIYVIGESAFLQRESSVVRFGADVVADFMRIVSGKILSVFGRGDKRLAVSTAVLGIRGTACYIEEQVGRTYFCLCYGEAEVVPVAAPQERETIRSKRHDHPIYIYADPAMPKSMVKAEILNHTDAELAMLESLVGRVPPFAGREDYKSL
ncbi:conserved exported protein of unknown function [Georgfuchsia toluolica]|uniref:FecR protein domain-containing protein n=1 Tax=Georgfuchsia toluolica TaxID=424218 RepID=A0A916J7Z9_9PROT|nr:hypothetical protein [Georgfuchsia toluolica]CAG4884076.1 conserved exported protein of unknown function [Georgfuchsia toluolica]